MSGVADSKHLSRRTFVKSASLSALGAAVGTGALSGMYGCSNSEGSESELAVTSESAGASEEKIVWHQCSRDYGCGAVMCPMQYHVVDGTVTYVESDNIGDSSFGGLQARGCLRGRSIKNILNHPDRLKYPMKRKEGTRRGDGEFEQISWDEATQMFADNLKRVIDTYGNEAVMLTWGGGTNVGMFARLMNQLGGHLGFYGSDSCGQIIEAMTYLGIGMYSSRLIDACEADLLVLFGNTPTETAMGGASASYDLARVRESGTKIISIDQRMNESCSAHPEEWVPIMNGTDAALCSAINYVLINEGLADEEFLKSHCIGYDDSNMPEGAPEHSSYRDYLFGTGYDMVAKTPEWASPITKIPVEKIYEIAREIGNAETVFISQGWGPQRHSNGESIAAAIIMVAVVSGNIGRPGTNDGGRDLRYNFTVPEFSGAIPTGDNPVTTSVPTVQRFEVIARGEEMTALHDGVRGKDKLDVGGKFVVFYNTNEVNQSQDFGFIHKTLQDETKAEFVVTCDIVMTPSCKYSDLIIPDTTWMEKDRYVCLLTAGAMEGVIYGQPVQDPQFECRNAYDFLTDVAERLGVKEQYTEGRTWKQWQEYIYEQGLEARPDLPSLEEGLEMGYWKQEMSYPNPLAGFLEDPEANPLGTPSGKIEIYSSRLQEMADSWEFDDPRDVISPIPIYTPGREGHADVNDEHPLVLTGWHPKQRSHSTFGGVDILKESVIQQIWINPFDAEPRNIANGDMVRVYNERGEVHISARVTPRIIPGVVGMPEGAWLEVEFDGDKPLDKGGNINVLTGRHWSPIAKHNPSHNSIVQVEKI